MRSINRSGSARLVWRMTAENQRGEILEVREQPHFTRKRPAQSSGRTPSERVPAPAQVSAGTGLSAKGSVSVCGWRASSYDLLRGLSVRDVSEKIPQQAFEALFSADPAAAGKL